MKGTLPTPVGHKNKKRREDLELAIPHAIIRTASLTEDKSHRDQLNVDIEHCSSGKDKDSNWSGRKEKEKGEPYMNELPFKRFCIGIPVALATTREMSLEVTRSCNIAIGDSSIASDSLSEGN